MVHLMIFGSPVATLRPDAGSDDASVMGVTMGEIDPTAFGAFSGEWAGSESGPISARGRRHKYSGTATMTKPATSATTI